MRAATASAVSRVEASTITRTRDSVPEARLYFFAGTQHTPGALPPCRRPSGDQAQAS